MCRCTYFDIWNLKLAYWENGQIRKSQIVWIHSYFAARSQWRCINRTILGTELNDTQNGTIRRLIIFVTVAFSIIPSIVPRPLRYVPSTAARNCAITSNCAHYWSKSNNTALSRWLFNVRTLITTNTISYSNTMHSRVTRLLFNCSLF